MHSLNRHPEVFHNKSEYATLRKIFDMVGYSGDVCDALATKPNLLQGTKQKNQILGDALILGVLLYFGKNPTLCKGMPVAILNKVLSFRDPVGELYFLGENPALWKGNDKLSVDILFQLLDLKEIFNLQHVCLRKTLILGVLDYLNKYSYLSHDMPIQVLNKVFSLTDPISALCLLGENTFLWKGSDKLSADILLEFVSAPQFGPTCSRLNTWLPFFQGPYALKFVDLKTIFNFQNNFNKDFANFIYQKITLVYLSVQEELRNNGSQDPYLNIQKFLNDTDSDKWNMIPRRPKNISENDWGILRDLHLPRILETIYPGDANERAKKDKVSAGLFIKCLMASDARTSAGLQAMKFRIASVVDYLEGLTAVLNNQVLDNSEKDLLTKKLKAIIDALDDGGQACPDRAIVGLTSAENRIKLFQDPEYMPNVLVNMFKLHQIEAKLINQNQKENLETYLYYTLKFNTILSLSLLNSTMLYEEIAIKQPLGQALAKLVTEFTLENLIGYAANLYEFRILFEDESEIKLQKIKSLMDDVYSIDDMNIDDRHKIILDIQSLEIKLEQPIINQILNKPQEVDSYRLTCILDNRRERIKDHFYEDKAKELFLKARFLINF